jgi:type IV pilus assembly protein PilC
MAAFTYKAIDAQGKISNGTLDTEDEGALTKALQERGLFLMEARKSSSPVKPPPAPTPMSQLSTAAQQTPKTLVSMRVPPDRIAIFTSELAVMTRTALPLEEALRVLSRQQPHPGFKAVLEDIAGQVQAGISLSEAFGRFPKVFDPVYISLLRAGEASGTVVQMLERLIVYLQFQRNLKAKVRSALIYPLIVVGATLGVVAFLLLFVLPHFAVLFSQMGSELPWPTRILLEVTHALRAGWWAGLLVLGGLGVGFFYWYRNSDNRRVFDTLLLTIPVVGTLARNIVMTRMLRILSALMSAGVPILQSLDLSCQSAGNRVFEALFKTVQDSVRQGQGIAASLYGNRYFPESVANMISNAELTGTLPDVLNKIADFYEQETDASLKDLFAMMEPLFVVILGLMVAGIAVAMLLPIFKLDSAIA